MIVTICGPSCAGKSTIEQILKSRGFGSVVSTTTRPMREGEVNGGSYHFVSVSDFHGLIDADALVEYVEFSGNYYGVGLAEIGTSDADIPKVIVCEPTGFQNIKKFCDGNNIPFFGVFVDGIASVIAGRFLSRAVNDISSCANEIESQEKLKTYVRRLAAMMSTEQEWRENVTDYDLYFGSFDAGNYNRHVDLIISNVYKRMGAK